ncbi:arrestin domain-containing protein 5-like isoform X2 [Danaus plexippus]|uniref:arrestin domain-containing protein 5-like isoform X2 n=1 Tax=Danaus plexippus TaxID=13037 RepID=UPI002AAF2F7F|nr:arrestin domain-containing protein 5-like isoform X2 [Danaus plexippus]
MGWNKCNIVLNSPESYFYTNNIVSGTVTLESKSKRKLKVVKGTSKAAWSRSAPTMPYIRVYTGKEKVFELQIDIFKELKGHKVKPGSISSQFHFILPPDLPSTYEDSVAKIYYHIILKEKEQQIIKIPITVISYVNLNHLQEYKVPTIYDMTKVCRFSEEVVVFLRTYKSFAPQQFVPFEAIISNEKNVTITKIVVKLIQKLEYNVSSGFYNAEKTVCKSEHLDIKNVARQTCTFGMNVPKVIPSALNDYNHMVKSSYLLRVKISFRFHFPLYSDIPVVVTSIPVEHEMF